MQLYRYFMSQSSEFCRHNPLCCFSPSVYCCCCCCCFRYDSVRKLLDTPSYVWTWTHSHGITQILSLCIPLKYSPFPARPCLLRPEAVKLTAIRYWAHSKFLCPELSEPYFVDAVATCRAGDQHNKAPLTLGKGGSHTSSSCEKLSEMRIEC
jgi:hypothetical protein